MENGAVEVSVGWCEPSWWLRGGGDVMQCRLFLAGFLLQTGLFHMVILLVLLICRTKQRSGPVNRCSVYDTLQGETLALAFCLGYVGRGVLRLSYSLCVCHLGLNSSCSGCRAPSLSEPLHGSFSHGHLCSSLIFRLGQYEAKGTWQINNKMQR